MLDKNSASFLTISPYFHHAFCQKDRNYVIYHPNPSLFLCFLRHFSLEIRIRDMQAAKRGNTWTIHFLLTFNFRLNRIDSVYSRFILYFGCTKASNELRDNADD
jgi:hypothetical protein